MIVINFVCTKRLEVVWSETLAKLIRLFRTDFFCKPNRRQKNVA